VLTERDILSILPFSNKIVKLEVNGATLRSVIEHGLSRTAEDAEPGRFPQVSGIEFSFDASRPPGSRIIDIRVNKRPLSDTKQYSLTTTNFLWNGGDGYAMLKDSRVLIPQEKGLLDFKLLQQTIRSLRSIAPRVETRIKRLDQGQPKSKPDCK
jgi:5'-nucleotidase